MKKFYYLLILCCCVSLSLVAQKSDLITISGIVKDQRSHQRLEYVNVTAVGTNLGTVTNMDGVFTIKLRNSEMIEFSHIGYRTAKVSIKALKSTNNVIFLNPKALVLNEVIVSPINAAKIVETAVHHVAINYDSVPSMLTGFYRETIQKKRKFINISEAVTNLYKSSYKDNDIDRDKVRILKGRKLISPKVSDTLAVKLEGGPVLAISLDVAKNPLELLDDDSRLNYLYKFIDYVSIGGRVHYAISFEPIRLVDYPLYKGVLYIDQKDYTISRVEFSIDMRDPLKVTSIILKKKPVGLIFKPLNLSYLVDYRRQNGRNYLNYVRADVKFRCDWHKRLFHTNYFLVSEMVVTNHQDNPEGRITYRDSFKKTQVLSDKVGDFYDSNFWGEYNIIEPTESLEHAVLKLKKSYKRMKNQ